MVRPRSVGTFLMSRRPTSAKLGGAIEDALHLLAAELVHSEQVLHRVLLCPRRLRWGDRDLVDAVGLLQPHVHPLARGGRQVLADVVGPDRELAVAAVREHGQLNPRRPAVVEEGVDRGPHRAAGVEHVVDKDDRPPREVEVEVGVVDDRCVARLAPLDVVAVEGDVEVAERDLGAGELADQRVQAPADAPRRACGCRPAPADPSPHSSRRSRGRYGPASAADRRGRARPSRRSPLRSFLASRDRVKGACRASVAAACDDLRA